MEARGEMFQSVGSGKGSFLLLWTIGTTGFYYACLGWNHFTFRFLNILAYVAISRVLTWTSTFEQLFRDMFVWGNTAEEVFEKGKKTGQILLMVSFDVKRGGVSGSKEEDCFLRVKLQGAMSTLLRVRARR